MSADRPEGIKILIVGDHGSVRALLRDYLTPAIATATRRDSLEVTVKQLKAPAVRPGDRRRRTLLAWLALCLALPAATASGRYVAGPRATPAGGVPYPMVDTGQTRCYDDQAVIPCPATGAFSGQDAQHAGRTPAYMDNGDGTVTDQVTGLMWQKSPGDKVSYAQATSGAAALRLGGHDDWRLPSIKELYSLILFSGTDPSGCDGPPACSAPVPFLDTRYFDFEYGDTGAGERLIDAQYWSSTPYVSTTMNGDATVFGVNFADGRIKGYPRDRGPGGRAQRQFVRYVRANPGYGVNDLVDNGDGTLTDRATGLMWTRADSGAGMDWSEALEWVGRQNAAIYLGHADWRLPDAKELQSIVDYTRAPDTSHSAAIDPRFQSTTIRNEGGADDYPHYWASTTHADNRGRGAAAVYVCFGRCLGFMEMPPNSGNRRLLDVHGAGSQRSDPKVGNPADFPYGRGPQGDVVRIDNYVRLVRDADAAPTPEPSAEPPATPTDTPPPTATPPHGTATLPPTEPPLPAEALYLPWAERRR